MQVIQNNKPDFASLLQPALHHQSPSAVLNDPDLEPFEKRAILSSWASDLYAVESCPWLREVPGVKKALRLSDILEALRALDDDDDPPPRGGAAMRLAGVRWPRTLAAFRRRRQAGPKSASPRRSAPGWPLGMTGCGSSAPWRAGSLLPDERGRPLQKQTAARRYFLRLNGTDSRSCA